MKKGNKKSKLKLAITIILAVIILVGALFAGACAILGTDIVFAGVKNIFAAPMNNFKAAWLFFTNDTQKIEEQLDETRKEFDDAVKDATGTELSDEVKEALNSGKYTEEEMILIISGVSIEEIEKMREAANNPETAEPTDEPIEEKPDETETSEKAEEPEKTQEQESVTPQNPVEQKPIEEKPPVADTPIVPEVPTVVPDVSDAPTFDEIVPTIQTDDTAATIAKLYIIKNKFMQKLENIEIEIINAYSALPKEQRVPQSRKSIAGQYISTVADLEIQCDAEVEAVLTELRTKLLSLEKDIAIIHTLKKAYDNEKSLKKAYYMDIYLNGVKNKDVPTLGKAAKS